MPISVYKITLYISSKSLVFRCDSMGFCAQFGSYTLMNLDSNKILDLQPVAVSSSPSLDISFTNAGEHFSWSCHPLAYSIRGLNSICQWITNPTKMFTRNRRLDEYSKIIPNIMCTFLFVANAS